MEQESKLKARNHTQDSQLKAEIYPVTEGLQSHQTADKYRINFNHFLDYIKIHDLQVLLDLGSDAIQALVIRYVRDMRDNKKYSRSTINTHCAAILRFMDMNDSILNKSRIKLHYPPDESTHDDRAYTHDEITKVLSSGCGDLRNKAIVLLMVSTGMRIGAIPRIEIGDLTKIPQWGNLYRVQVYARTRDKYYTFCTPECAKAIDDYLAYRRRYKEELKDRSPLFRKHFNKADPFIINQPKFLSTRSLMNIIDEVLKRSGVKTLQVMRSHGFRKFAITQMIKAKVDYSTREYLVGHKISRGLDQNYDRTTEEDRLSQYALAVDALTIDPTQRLQKRLDEQNLRHSEEWNALKAQMNELKQLLDEPIK
jgi:integrase